MSFSLQDFASYSREKSKNVWYYSATPTENLVCPHSNCNSINLTPDLYFDPVIYTVVDNEPAIVTFHRTYYKCKSCGYRFKPSDSDLCPECFTARDDIGCESFGDGHGAHTHFKDAAGSDDFSAEQLREESRLTGAEMAEEFADFTDSVRRSLSSETPPNTYRKAPQSPWRPESAFLPPPV